MSDKILKLVQKRCKKSGHSSGVPFVALMNRFKLSKKELIKIVKQLKQQKKVYLREGINDLLIYEYI